MITVALIGRPNVGKSSLFNVLSQTRQALVADIPGLTRDRNYTKIFVNQNPLWLVDTGGFEPKNKDFISFKMSEQTQIAIDECDCIQEKK
jgi:GTPase